MTSVLVFPAGEINAIELHDALATCVNIKLFGASSVERHGSYVFKNYISNLPLISDPGFIDVFNKLIKQHHIDVIFPTHDSVSVFMADHQDEIDAKIIGADKKTAAICRDKQKTYGLFNDQSFVPKLVKDFNLTKFPVFVKPKEGQGSVGAKRIDNLSELKEISLEDYVVVEFLPGDELTVDCLTDKNGELRVISPRSRERILAGVSVAGTTQLLTQEIQSIAEAINRRLVFRGLWFFQIKKDETGRFKLLEISTRCAGAMGLTRARGINLPLLSVYVALGYDIEVIPNSYTVHFDRTLISRYKIDYDYDSVYFDFDDTLIINGMIHPYSIMFLYQCKNHGKKVYLITKHEKHIKKTLKEYAISEDLFTDIISLDASGNKIENIRPDKAIFIDNAFQERKLVYEKFKIPVFDVDGIEVLLDWRT